MPTPVKEVDDTVYDSPPNDRAIQQVQEDEYGFPYHYIPEVTGSRFLQTRHWSWGYRYLGGLRVVTDALRRIDFSSLVDIGCGDGRFLHEARREFPGVRLKGIDYSERAIAFARAFTPDVEFEARNIIEEPSRDSFDVATLIEVLEHIPPDSIPRFVEGIRECLKPGGKLIVTVPHRNVPLIEKHFQHFDSESLKSALKTYFRVDEFSFLDSRSDFPLRLLGKMLGIQGRHCVVTNEHLNRAFIELYFNKYLYTSKESDCRRLLAVATLRQ